MNALIVIYVKVFLICILCEKSIYICLNIKKNIMNELEQRTEDMRLRMDRAFREVLQLSSTKEVKACCNVAIKFLLANSINSTSKQESDECYKFWLIVADKINR